MDTGNVLFWARLSILVPFIVSIIFFGWIPEHRVSVFIPFWPVWRFGNAACRSQPLQSRSLNRRYLFWLVTDVWKPPHPTPFPCWKLGWLGPTSSVTFPKSSNQNQDFLPLKRSFFPSLHNYFRHFSCVQCNTVTAFHWRQYENGRLLILILTFYHILLIWWRASGVATSSSPTRCLDWLFFNKSFAIRDEVMKLEDVALADWAGRWVSCIMGNV